MAIFTVTTTDELQKILDKIQNPNEFLEGVSKILVQSTRSRLLSSKTGPDGSRWAPWATSTRVTRQKAGTAGKGLLNDSGTLLNAIQGQVSGRQAIVGVNKARAPYGSFLQLGTKNMPARPFIGISRQDRGQISDLLRTYLANR